MPPPPGRLERELPLYLTEDEVAELITMADALEAVEACFQRLGRGEATCEPRRRVRAPGGVLHVMFAADPAGGFLGLKSYTTFRNSIRFHVMLYDAADGSLLAIIEADRLGRLRTGAASGVATKLLARSDARVAAVIGTGHQAATQIEALSYARGLDEVRVFSRDPARRKEFAESCSAKLGLWVLPAESAERAVEGAAIVTTITASKDPVLEGAWLEAGAHVNAAGSNSLMRREIDVCTVERAGLVVVDSLEAVELEGGDLLPSLQSGRLYREGIVELGSVAAGLHPGRTSPEEITLFKSHGIASEDVALAGLLFRRAVDAGVGCRLPG